MVTIGVKSCSPFTKSSEQTTQGIALKAQHTRQTRSTHHFISWNISVELKVRILKAILFVSHISACVLCPGFMLQVTTLTVGLDLWSHWAFCKLFDEKIKFKYRILYIPNIFGIKGTYKNIRCCCFDEFIFSEVGQQEHPLWSFSSDKMFLKS